MFKHTIDTDLELRLLEHHHAPLKLETINSCREYLREWLPWVDGTKSLEDEIKFIDMSKKQYMSNEGFQAGIWYDGEFAGIIGFHEISWSNRSVSIGYWLDRRYMGKGIMTKACRALINHAFYEYQLNRVEIRCAKENYKSRAIPERLGFSEEG